jgi:hypothetical protein
MFNYYFVSLIKPPDRFKRLLTVSNTKQSYDDHDNIKVVRTFNLFQLDILIDDINVRETHGETTR